LIPNSWPWALKTQAALTDLGVMPKPGGDGEQEKPDYRRQGPHAP
jgi:hypothetical protein